MSTQSYCCPICGKFARLAYIGDKIVAECCSDLSKWAEAHTELQMKATYTEDDAIAAYNKTVAAWWQKIFGTQENDS